MIDGTTMRASLTTLLLLLSGAAHAQQLPGDIPKTFKPNQSTFDYDRREVEIPMRDGVKLHTVIIVPTGATNAPMLLDRTPYGANTSTTHGASANVATVVSRADAMLLAAGYIAVWEDVRGKHDSGGDYVNERPLRGPLNPTKIDHATDAYDTIDWLVKHVPESNGRVGMLGTSYDGMMVAMALTDPHPALKAAVPMNPVINTWMGDDDYHGGAFRLIGYDYYYAQDAAKGDAGDLWRDAYDDYDTFLRAGSAQSFVNSRGLDQLPWVKRLDGHPAYDRFWQAQALEKILPKRAPTVPTLWVASQWDQEDMYGAVAAYEAMKPVDPTGLNQLVIGPWAHGGEGQEGSSLGAISFGQDTALAFRRDILIPFLDAHLKDGGKPDGLAPVTAFQTGTNRWQSLPTWPLACDVGCRTPMQKLYLQPAGGLGFMPPPVVPGRGPKADSYVSDPAKPIPYRLRPISPTYATGSTWKQWLVDDQRPFSDRTDVLTYETPVLTQPVAIAGAAVANIVAATTGTDGDFVVKLIDVYPAEYRDKPEIGGYQLGVAMDIFRGRYREGYEVGKPIAPNVPLAYRFALPNASHVFLPGHRIMVQIQSSWFPLYDRNPQKFVPTIIDAKPGDYQKATISVFHSPTEASYVELPVVPVK